MCTVTDPVQLAEGCVGCHVGAPPSGDVPALDVNHDLIAAGHPRLNFELTVFLANLPRHWSEQAEKKRLDREPLIWLAGQAAAAHAALSLLAYRAQSQQAPWPEFSEYDCFGCHHDLQGSSRRQKNRSGQGHPGSLSWGGWYFAMAETSRETARQGDKETGRQGAAGGGMAPEQHSSPLDNLRQVMEKSFPDRARVLDFIGPAAKQIEQWQGRMAQRSSSRLPRDLLENIGPPPDSWDAAEQTYLALAALSQGQGGKEIEAELNGLARLLAFPSDAVEGHYDSPQEFAPAKYNERLKKVRELFGNPKR
jgi:hypothetical protein